MNKLKQLLMQPDKKEHWQKTYILTTVLSIFVPVFLAFIVTQVIMSIGKEIIWDKWLKKGVYDIGDIYANAIGGVFALIIILLIKRSLF